jgi:hypothetical protein
MRPLASLTVVLAAAAAAGCTLTGCALGLPAPGAAGVTRTAVAGHTAVAGQTAAATTTAQATRAPAPLPPLADGVVGGWRHPLQAVQVFAATYVNWTAATVWDHLEALSEVSIGQARAAMRQAAAGVAGDYELHHSGIANSGTVEAVAPLDGRPHSYVVVTLERTTATAAGAYRDLPPAWHVTLATVAPVGRGLWVLSAWQPQS